MAPPKSKPLDRIHTRVALLHLRSYFDQLDQASTAEDSLYQLAQLALEVEWLTRREVDKARRSGASWRDVGRALGISKQGAQQRFSHLG